MTSDLLSRPARAAAQVSVGRGGGPVSLSDGAPVVTGTATAPVLLLLFIFSILPPIYFFLGDTRLSLTRIFLLVMTIPLTVRLLSGAVGRILAADILMFLFSVWMALLILYHEGIERIPFAGITVVEILGGYLVGRTLIRNVTDYKLLLRYLVIAQLILLPFAMLEFFTNINLLHDFFGQVFNTFQKAARQTWRSGYARVISGFEHPILFGLFCAITVAPFFYWLKSRPLLAFCLATLPFGMTYLSLSSAPLIAAGLCMLLIAWDYASGGRWKLLIWIGLFLYVFLSIASNRGPIIILIDNLTFNPHTAWTRIWIYTYGSAEVMRHPFTGIGLSGSWQRPSWLTGSVDNFWLVIAMRYGLPGLILLVLSLVTGILVMTRAKGLSREESNIRTGHVIALVGLYFSLTTVHIWGDTSSFLLFFIGAGLWLGATGDVLGTNVSRPMRVPVDTGSSDQPDIRQPMFQATKAASPRSAKLPTSRFAPTHHRVSRKASASPPSSKR